MISSTPIFIRHYNTNIDVKFLPQGTMNSLSKNKLVKFCKNEVRKLMVKLYNGVKELEMFHFIEVTKLNIDKERWICFSSLEIFT